MVRAKKWFGQHFLREDGVAQRIVESLTLTSGAHHVIEVGPGTGALTRHLLQRTDLRLTCVEVDAEAADFLAETFPQLGNDLVRGDLLTLDLEAMLARAGANADEPFAVIGNFPYNISTQIVFRILAHRHRCMEVVGMFQKEVADRIVAPPGSRTYGITSVLTQAWYTVETLFDLGPESFDPPPRVHSSVIRMQRNKVRKLPCDEAIFFRVVKTAFNQRRKTLHNALKPMAELAGRVPAHLAGMRAEQLSVEEFVELTQVAQGS